MRDKHKATIGEHRQRCDFTFDKSGVVVPGKFEIEISHHYGLERFRDYGLAMITLVNREYCKKILICLPNQTHPEQYHKRKKRL